jgi:hypothetical protein
VVTGRSKPPPIVVRGITAPSVVPEVLPMPTSRKVVLPLPFLATRVTFDDDVRDLSPATDVVAFDVPTEAGLHHKVAVVALDGSHAEGNVHEEDGIARPDGDGLIIILSDSMPIDPRPASGRPARPIGTVHNGFTKLR